MKELEFITDHVDILTVDKRAFYIMILEVTKEIEGKISKDHRRTWITPEEFEEKHQDILSLSYDEANEISLKEVKMIQVVEERDPENWNEAEEKYGMNFWDILEEKQLKLTVYAQKLGMKINYKELASEIWGNIDSDDVDVIDYDQDTLEDYFYLALKRKKDFQIIKSPNIVYLVWMMIIRINQLLYYIYGNHRY